LHRRSSDRLRLIEVIKRTAHVRVMSVGSRLYFIKLAYFEKSGRLLLSPFQILLVVVFVESGRVSVLDGLQGRVGSARFLMLIYIMVIYGCIFQAIVKAHPTGTDACSSLLLPHCHDQILHPQPRRNEEM
jgi:hypothetical protein